MNAKEAKRQRRERYKAKVLLVTDLARAFAPGNKDEQMRVAMEMFELTDQQIWAIVDNAIVRRQWMDARHAKTVVMSER
ncbi:MAG: hypothetical protein PVS3B3_38860 [Ktedonobacteraceae bacterium]